MVDTSDSRSAVSRVTDSSSAKDTVIHRSTLGGSDCGAEPWMTSSEAAVVSPEDLRNALEIERSRTGDALSVYVHLPFCPSRCLTCNNQTSINHDSRQIDRYIDALEREVALVTEHLGTQRRLQQLHLGGGTPNYLSDLQLVRLIDILDRHFVIDEHTDASLEANAHRASHTQLALLHGLGFRSINLAVRDLDTKVQEALGRKQSLSVVRDVIESARAVGFTRVSTDLVFGLPSQNAATVRGTIDKLLTLDPDRVYCSAFARRAAVFEHQNAVDRQQLPSLGDKIAMFSRIVEGLGDAGYDWIGLDCFARPDDAISRAHRDGTLHRNWIGYTAESGRSVVGLGSSAASDLETVCTRNAVSIDQWRDTLTDGRLPIEQGVRVTPQSRELRHALSDLICNSRHGTTEPRATKSPPVGDRDQPQSVLSALRDDGFVELNDENGVVVTESGRRTLHQLWGDSSPAYRWNGLL